ncbi:MAG TPA: zf-HC2 domain-containing protein [Blastocatellia bacterium]|nr:zf-HC2 domain-containing protein [Blastocatellia bacterium]
MTPNYLSSSACGRQEDLIAYLYNEASRDERAGFERHLKECAGCSADLKAFQNVRHELELWQAPFAPRLEITLPKSRWQALGELLALFPLWLRLAAAGAVVTAAALVLFSILGTTVSIGSGGVSVAFGQRQSVIERPADLKPAPAGLLTRAEAEAMIEQAVAAARMKSQTETQVQLAALEQRLNVAHEAKLANLTRKLRNDYRQMLAGLNQPSLREWLFAANEEPETEVKDNEKSN